jgi:hypothetical protein
MAAPKQTKIEQPIVDDFKFDTSFQPVVSASSTIPKATSFGDFTDSFKFDASPANGFGDLDAAFGGAPKSTEPASNPFGNVDFDAAFSTPFPAPVPSNPVSTTSATSAPMSPPTATPKTSSSQGDSPEVQNIIGMGFSREQAINALEMYSCLT